MLVLPSLRQVTGVWFELMSRIQVPVLNSSTPI